jgi:uncharacterized protein
MTVQVDYPGVYIEEFTPGAPIDGVGTSTASFMGLWQFGVPNKPEKLFSWDDFLRKFGNPSPLGDTIPQDNEYLYYAVRGFFQNGGRVCYVTRVSNAKADWVNLDDDAANMTPAGAPQPTIKLVAREAKRNSPPISVNVSHSSATTTALFVISSTNIADANIGATAVKITTANIAQQFRPADRIFIGDATTNETRVINRIDGDFLRFVEPLTKNFTTTASKKVKLADLAADTRVIRVADDPSMSNLAVGSVIKLTGSNIPSTSPIYKTVKSISLEVINSRLKTWRVLLQDKLNSNVTLSTNIRLQTQEFQLTVSGKLYERLSMDSGNPRYCINVINSDQNGLVNAFPADTLNITEVPFNRPKITNVTLTGGQSETRNTIGQNEYETVLKTLSSKDDINIVCAPGVTDIGTQGLLVSHCDTLTKDRFAVLDSKRVPPITDIENVIQQMASVKGENKGFAALYYPWIQVPSVSDDNHLILIPPSGHIAGVYARTDNNRGVHKAPAGTEAGLNGVIGIEKVLTDTEQGDLNKTYGVNVIRVFQAGATPIIWGARTTATQDNKNWQYVNVRRLFLFLEESIQEGIRWAVFEPNNLALWSKLKRVITAFLTQQWRDGALFGATANEAFYVRIDEALNPPDQRALGKLNIEIGIKPVYPAEFIVVRIGIWQGGSDVTVV